MSSLSRLAPDPQGEQMTPQATLDAIGTELNESLGGGNDLIDIKVALLAAQASVLGDILSKPEHERLDCLNGEAARIAIEGITLALGAA